MKKFEKILFFYSIVAITAIFLVNAAFSPNLQSLISAVILLPLVGYFWLRLTDPHKVSIENWTTRLIIVIVILTAFAFLAFYKARSASGENNNQEARIGDLQEEIKGISQELSQKNDLIDDLERENSELSSTKDTKTPEIQNILGDTFSDLLTNKKVKGFIRLKEGFEKANVYENPTYSSQITEQIVSGTSYAYLEAKDPWFQIKTSLGQGWVEKTSVEITADEEE